VIPQSVGPFNSTQDRQSKKREDRHQKQDRFHFPTPNLKFLSGKLRDNVVATLIISGVLQPDSLTGGCGWWVSSKDLVIAYGATPVQQTFPSKLGLEYEGLLNGLQSAIRKGIKHLIVKGSIDLIFALNSMNGMNYYFSTINYQLKDIQTAVSKALKQFQHLELEMVRNAQETYYPMKLAEKGIADLEKKKVESVLKLQNESTEYNPRDIELTDRYVANAAFEKFDDMVACSQHCGSPYSTAGSSLASPSSVALKTARSTDTNEVSSFTSINQLW
jgi:hypothetical protein